jgi:uncharacterized protein YvpB
MQRTKTMKSTWFKDLIGALGLAAVIVPIIGAGTYTVMTYTSGQQKNAPSQGLSPTVLASTSNDNQNYIEYLQQVQKANTIASTPKVYTDQIELDIPLIKQIYPLSCEVASLQMALKYRGIEASQDELLAKIPISEPMKMTEKEGQLIWGDPDKGFVGDVRGWFFNDRDGLRGATGWGVNNVPVAKLASQYRPGSEAKSGASLNDIKLALTNKKPVIIWYVLDDIKMKDQKLIYFTPSGKQITFVENHVSLITGYGKDESGSVVYTIKDPTFGDVKMKESDLLRQWEKYDREIVVVN